MSTQLIIVIATILVFVFLGFMLNISIKKHEIRKATYKKKKGHNRYMPEYKKPGK